MITCSLRSILFVAYFFLVASPLQAQTASNQPAAGLSEEARILIEAGNAAAQRAQESRSLSTSIATRLAELEAESGDAGVTQKLRALTLKDFTSDRSPSTASGNDDETARQILEALQIDAELAAKESEDEAIEAWKRAMAIDPEAQDSILRRLLGTKPDS